MCDTDLSVFADRGQRGALHEENLLQAAAALLHSPGHWHAVLQRPVSAHPRGRVTYLRAVFHFSTKILGVDFTSFNPPGNFLGVFLLQLLFDIVFYLSFYYKNIYF